MPPPFIEYGKEDGIEDDIITKGLASIFEGWRRGAWIRTSLVVVRVFREEGEGGGGGVLVLCVCVCVSCHDAWGQSRVLDGVVRGPPPPPCAVYIYVCVCMYVYTLHVCI
jgi:hypothetical protein